VLVFVYVMNTMGCVYSVNYMMPQDDTNKRITTVNVWAGHNKTAAFSLQSKNTLSSTVQHTGEDEELVSFSFGERWIDPQDLLNAYYKKYGRQST